MIVSITLVATLFWMLLDTSAAGFCWDTLPRLILLFTVASLLPLTDNDPPIVDCALDAADRLILMFDESDREDTDSDGGFWAGAHAVKSQVLNTAPPNTAPRKN